jgi:3-deoxy-D-manno-octulosonate 8-phosphate phosphatase (KDO 8-P phosphatase)
VIHEKASKIKLLFLDVDGVLTDGRITINDRGDETKSFDVKDGQGLRMLMAGGIEVVLVSGRRSRSVDYRAKDLGIEAVHQAVSDKRDLCRRLLNDRGLKKQEACCMGDDIPDLAMFAETGLCIAVADAVKEVREAADFITRNRGGFGAVREACEWLLRCQAK